MSYFHYCITDTVRPYGIPECSTCRLEKCGREFDPVEEITQLRNALVEITDRDCVSEPECHKVLSRQYWCLKCIAQEVLSEPQIQSGMEDDLTYCACWGWARKGTQHSGHHPSCDGTQKKRQ